MRRVLVTGGAGYIGCCVIEELLKRGHKPVVFDSFYWGKESLQPVLDKIEIIEGDCRNSKDVIYALENVDSIIHLAGIVGEAACLRNQKAHFSINVESTRTLVNCCTDPEMELVRDFIFASSCSVYGNVQGMYEEVTETTPTRPLSAYAHAKLLAEKIILDKAKEIPHFHPTILRLSTVFGWSNRPRLDLVTNAFAYNAWKNGKLTIHGDGQQYRSLIHVKDIAKAFVDILEAPRLMRSSEIFHVGEETNNKTVKEIAETAKALLPNTEIEFITSKKTDRRDYRINCQKIKNVIGWKAEWSMENGMKDILENLKTLNLDWESDKYRNSSYKYV
ncbi:SDR family oxidoreductase [Candidatus Woesearchaeota archaeon]|nr:SDR family oxidoreductase [Candidatus Woesearchaeota archaeon]MBW3006505.1 SDR family oxidoreductase [Candidatus Woesearchaeota archaeon]